VRTFAAGDQMKNTKGMREMNRLSRNEFSRSEAERLEQERIEFEHGRGWREPISTMPVRPGTWPRLGRRTAQVALITGVVGRQTDRPPKGWRRAHTVRNGSGWKAAAHQPRELIDGERDREVVQ